MPTAPRTRTVRALALILTAAAASVVLAACTSGGTDASRTSSSATAGGQGGAASQSTDAATPTPTPTGGAGALTATPLSVPCDALAPDATVTAAYAGMSSVPKPVVPAKTDAAVIGAYEGTLCQWKSDTATMTLAVGRFDDDSLTRLKNSLVRTSNAVPTYDGEGYFDLVGSTGTAEAFTGSYWVVAVSDDPVFGEPGGAEPLVDAAITALKAGV